MLQTIIKEQQEGKAFSGVSSRCAETLLGALDVIEVDGRAEFPIIIPMGTPSCEDFDYSKYHDENAGTPDLMEHHKTQLAKFGIPFGQGGYAMYDLHTKRMCLCFAVKGQLYHGTTDCCLAPFGLLGNSPAKLLRVGFEHKKSKIQGGSVSTCIPILSMVLLILHDKVIERQNGGIPIYRWA